MLSEMLHQQSWIDKTKKKPLEFLAEIMQEDQAVRTVPERSRIRPDHPSHHIMVAQANGHLVPRNTTRLAIDADRGSRIADLATWAWQPWVAWFFCYIWNKTKENPLLLDGNFLLSSR